MRIGMSKQNQQNNDFRRLFPTLLRHLLKLKKKKNYNCISNRRHRKLCAKGPQHSESIIEKSGFVCDENFCTQLTIF